jgi:uncharacterized phage protein (TIGR02218 family)
MSFQDEQQSVSSGSPILLFEFFDGVRYWRYTDQAKVVVKDSENFNPEIVSLDKLGQNLAEGPQGFSIRIANDSSIAQEFKPYLPPRPIWVRVFTRHLSDPDAQYVVPCIGECASARFDDDGFVQLLVQPSLAKGKRVIPWPMYSTTCNWGVYSAACGVNKELFRVDGNLDSFDILELSVSELATKPDGYFTAGMMIRVSTGETRWILLHAGVTVTLAAPLTGLTVGEALIFYAGCDGLESTCQEKFNNLPRFLGFPDVPTRNPFVDNVFGTASSAAGSVTNLIRGRFRV